MTINNFLNPVGELPSTYEGPDNLINGSFPLVTTIIKIAKDEPDLKRGSLLGLITLEGSEKGKYRLAKFESKDGSEKAVCVLADDHKASGPNPVTAYLTGQFNSHALTLGSGFSVSDLTAELRKLSIFISPSIARVRL